VNYKKANNIRWIFSTLFHIHIGLTCSQTEIMNFSRQNLTRRLQKGPFLKQGVTKKGFSGWLAVDFQYIRTQLSVWRLKARLRNVQKFPTGQKYLYVFISCTIYSTTPTKLGKRGKPDLERNRRETPCGQQPLTTFLYVFQAVPKVQRVKHSTTVNTCQILPP
jgi:hypothetical protein